METNNDHPFYYCPIGDSAYSPAHPRRTDRFTILTRVPSGRVVGRLTIEEDRFVRSRYLITATLYRPGGVPFVLPVRATRKEVEFLFRLPGCDQSLNDLEHIAPYGDHADFGRPGLCIGKGNYTCFPGPGTKKPGSAAMSLKKKAYMDKPLMCLLDTGHIR